MLFCSFAVCLVFSRERFEPSALVRRTQQSGQGTHLQSAEPGGAGAGPGRAAGPEGNGGLSALF